MGGILVASFSADRATKVSIAGLTCEKGDTLEDELCGALGTLLDVNSATTIVLADASFEEHI
jgi:hypothetical protein